MADWQRTHTCGELRDTHVGQELDLVASGHVTGGEGRNDQSDREIADDCRQPDPSREPARSGSPEKHQADVEDERRRHATEGTWRGGPTANHLGAGRPTRNDQWPVP